MTAEIIIMLICALLLLFLISRFTRFEAKARGTRRLRVLIILLLSAVILICGLREWGPRGSHSLFGEAGEGENEGTGSEELYPGEAGDGDAEITVIIISGNQVDVGSRSFCFTDDSDGGFARFAAAGLQPGATVRVIDSYAISDTYREVIAVLEKLGITPDELSE